MFGEMEQFQHWDSCDECGFHGLIGFRTRAEEDYQDDDALGFMMDSTCPACGFEQSVLMIAEQYREMVLLRRAQQS